MPRTSANEWRVLQAVVEFGGFAQAALQLHRSQSSVSYAISQLQTRLGLALLEPDGRRMRLTPAGEVLLKDAAQLVKGLERLEERAVKMAQGWEAEVRLAVDTLFPTTSLLSVLADFAATCADTRLALHEVVMSGADDALYAGQIDLAVATGVPPGFLGDWLMDAQFVAVAAPTHPLHRLGRSLLAEDLVDHTQAVVRDSGHHAPRDAGWLGARQRWTVSKGETSLAAVKAGLAFAWLPFDSIRDALEDGTLLPLPLRSGQHRYQSIYLIEADPAQSGPATRQLGVLFKNAAARRNDALLERHNPDPSRSV